MSEWLLYGKCETCYQKKFLVRKRWIKLPTGALAKSLKLMCGTCIGKIRKVFDENKK